MKTRTIGLSVISVAIVAALSVTSFANSQIQQHSEKISDQAQQLSPLNVSAQEHVPEKSRAHSREKQLPTVPASPPEHANNERSPVFKDVEPEPVEPTPQPIDPPYIPRPVPIDPPKPFPFPIYPLPIEKEPYPIIPPPGYLLEV